MAIPSFILELILKSVGPKLLEKLFDLILEWAKSKAKDNGIEIVSLNDESTIEEHERILRGNDSEFY